MAIRRRLLIWTGSFGMHTDVVTRNSERLYTPVQGKRKGSVDLYGAYSRESSKALRHRSHSFTCKQLHACIPRKRSPDGATTDYSRRHLVYRPRKDKRLSWSDWLTYRGRFTHISGYPSAVGRAQDRESSPKNLATSDQRSTAVPRNHL